MKHNRSKIIKLIISLGIVSALPMLSNITVSSAINSSLEQEFISVIEQYDSEDVIVENGISLRKGEILDLSQYPNWQLSNEDTVKITQKGKVEPISEGTVYLSQKIDDKVHVIEIYVPSTQVNSYMLSQNVSTRKRENYKVFIDPGHGGSDNGASGFGYYEDELNLQVATKVKEKLEAKGIEVMMSRTSDIYLGLGERATMANNYGADVYVSIHQNSAPSSPTANGIETYYHSAKTNHKPLSTEIQTNAIKETGATDRKVKSADFAVLRESYMPSSLFESGFISNEVEAQKLADGEYQNKLAEGIATGIENYLKQYTNLEGEVIPPTEEATSTGTVINTDSLNVRSGYGTSNPVIGTLAKGEKVEIYDTQNGWHKINYNGTYGHVSASYIKLDSSVEEDISFTDIENHWAKASILDFAKKGHVNGYEDGTFKPNSNITRAEFVAIVNSVFGFNDIGTENFDDVNPGNWFYDAVRIGIKAGYIDGYTDGTFKPNEKITRQEAAKIVAKITNLKGDKTLGFKDNDDIASWAKDYVDALVDNNIMGGYEDNTFKPKNPITRAESVATLSRIK